VIGHFFKSLLSFSTGDIVGSIELMAVMEEDLTWLYGESPYACPDRPADEFNLAMFQVHLARMFTIFQDIKNAFAWYHWVVSWQNPIVTGFSLFLFVHFCISFDPAYFASYPLFVVILRMVQLAIKRRRGRLKNRLLQKEVEEYRKVR